MKTETNPRPSLRERRRIETTAQIVDAARALFAENGYQATRASDIAERAGVSDATLFRYFASKSDIALAGLTERINFVLARMADQPPELSALEAARSVVTDVADLDLFGPDDPVVAEVMLVATTPELWPEVDATINNAVAAAATVLAEREGRDTPTLRDRVLGHTIVGAIQAAATTWLEDPGGPRFTALLEQAFAVLGKPDRPESRSTRRTTT